MKKRMVQIMTKRIAPKLDFGRKLLLLAIGSLAIAVPVAIGILNAAQSQAQSSAAALPSFEVASDQAQQFQCIRWLDHVFFRQAHD